MKKSVKILLIAVAVLLAAATVLTIILIKPKPSDTAKTPNNSSEDELDYTELLQRSPDTPTFVYESEVTTYADGNISYEKFGYDDNGNMLFEEVKYSYSDDFKRTEYEYDSRGNLICKTEFEGNVLVGKSTYQYNDRNDLILHTDITYHFKSGEYENTRYFYFDYEYNADGYITRLTQRNEAKDAVVYVSKILWTIEYSEDNKLRSVTEEIVNPKEYLQSRPDYPESSKTTVYIDDKLRKEKIISYNDDGTTRVIHDSKTDENGDFVISFYDEDGNLTQTERTKYYTNGLVKSSCRFDAEGEKFAEKSYKYNKYGEYTETYENNISYGEANLVRYDEYGNKIYSKVEYRNLSLPSEYEFKNTLDENGNLLKSECYTNDNLCETTVYSGYKAFKYTKNEKESPVNPKNDSLFDGFITSYLL